MVTVKNTVFDSAIRWGASHNGNVGKKEILSSAKKLGLSPKGFAISKGSSSVDSVGWYANQNGYSLESTIALSTQGTSIYVVALNEDRFVLVVVDEGAVLPGSGFSGTLEEVSREIENTIRVVLPDAPIFCTDPVAIGSEPEWQPVSIDSIVDVGRKVAIQSLASDQKLMIPLVVIVFAVVAGGGFYYWQSSHSKMQLPTLSNEEKQARMKIAAFNTQQTNLLNTFKEQNNAWVTATAERVDRQFAVNAFGWEFTGADCSRQSCKLIWSVGTGERAFFEPFTHLMGFDSKPYKIEGVQSVSLAQAGVKAEINATWDLPKPQWISLSTKTGSLPESKDEQDLLWDFKQIMGQRFGIQIEPGKPAITNLVPTAVPPGVISVIKKGSISATGQSIAQLTFLVNALDNMGFYATKLVYSPGTSSKINKQWKVEASYVAR